MYVVEIFHIHTFASTLYKEVNSASIIIALYFFW